MNDDVIDLRKSDRFVVVEPIEGIFGATPIVLLNVSLGGLQVLHAAPLRIGTRATLSFHKNGESASVVVLVVWSHLSQTSEGLRYRSGVKLDAPDVGYARALNAYVRLGIVAMDTDSLERKRQREQEREMRRKSSPKMPLPPPTS
ncbi:MAG TPA: PilZ domain-containing protein [Thermoanaerobaculia bacterium]|nr:PilZ domain-containing protein [Thermoanaerobaculia bacterium]